MHAQMKSKLYLHFLIEQKKETNEAEDVPQEAIESAATARQCTKTPEDREEVTVPTALLSRYCFYNSFLPKGTEPS